MNCEGTAIDLRVVCPILSSTSETKHRAKTLCVRRSTYDARTTQNRTGERLRWTASGARADASDGAGDVSYMNRTRNVVRVAALKHRVSHNICSFLV
jgi:hypothetical protein